MFWGNSIFRRELKLLYMHYILGWFRLRNVRFRAEYSTSSGIKNLVLPAHNEHVPDRVVRLVQYLGHRNCLSSRETVDRTAQNGLLLALDHKVRTMFGRVPDAVATLNRCLDTVERKPGHAGRMNSSGFDNMVVIQHEDNGHISGCQIIDNARHDHVARGWLR